MCLLQRVLLGDVEGSLGVEEGSRGRFQGYMRGYQSGWCQVRTRRSRGQQVGSGVERTDRSRFGKVFLIVEFQIGKDYEREILVDCSKCRIYVWIYSRREVFVFRQYRCWDVLGVGVARRGYRERKEVIVEDRIRGLALSLVFRGRQKYF